MYSKNSWALYLWPMIAGSCLAMIISPIDASIPSTTVVGKTAQRRAARSLLRTS